MKVICLMLVCLGLVACQGGMGKQDSRFTQQQLSEDYINSPAFINVQLGAAYMKEGELSTALSKLKKALGQNPDLAIAHSTIAILYEQINENDLAGDHYRRSVELDAKDPRLRNNYGQFLCKNGYERQGIEQFELAAANPLYQFPYKPLLNAGLCAVRINEDRSAEDYFRKALQSQANLIPALVGMVNLLVKQGRYQQAKSYLQRYSALTGHTAETLWAAYQIEKNIGDQRLASNFAVRLKSRFPDSPQTQLLLEEMALQ